LLSEKAYRLTLDKESTYSIARGLGISVPRQRVVATPEEVEVITRDFGLPIVAKPRRSVESNDPLSRRAVRKIKQIEEISSVIVPMLRSGPILIQEHFEGIGIGVEVLCRNGEVLVAFQHQRIHEAIRGGGSSYRRSVELDPQLLNATHQLMNAVGYTGVCMVEFRYNARSRRWVLLEINGRFWGSLPLAIATGVDFPLYLYEMLASGKTSFPHNYDTHIYCRNWLLDLAWLRDNLKSDRSDPTLCTLPLCTVAAEMGNILSLRERSDTFTLDDPGPAMEELGRLWTWATSRLYPVRLHMQRGALRALRNASSVLFVCRGNICRSPFAELYMQRLLPNLQVSSVGMMQVSGRRSPVLAIQAAARQGLDLSRHCSRVWTDEDLKRWDVIFVLDISQYCTIQRFARAHNLRTKVFFLGALEAHGTLEIPDPYGQDRNTFDAVYRRIMRLLDRAVQASRPDFAVRKRNAAFHDAQAAQQACRTTITSTEEALRVNVSRIVKES
jgi:protein-tyrosine-phosphatase